MCSKINDYLPSDFIFIMLPSVLIVCYLNLFKMFAFNPGSNILARSKLKEYGILSSILAGYLCLNFMNTIWVSRAGR